MSVAFGAFGAHALRESLPANLLVTFNTAVDYQMFHSLALLFVAVTGSVLSDNLKSSARKALGFCGWAFFLGILLFSGSLYALALSGQAMLGAITPFGGLCFLAGWAALVVFAFKQG